MLFKSFPTDLSFAGCLAATPMTLGGFGLDAVGALAARTQWF
ncbi:Uncharacterized protein YP598_0699 [Yersinia pseudotuberculosis]|uniref:Uncharacterized protein n=1 Tax=Yersinia pseudotuberculosis serotype O:1b (strain IP 31758) TaxID=349747 RepID=A0A0U1R2S3_YERP3|nr:hypothetical protein [Yersinia pseudotuberculosis]ABS49592.1 hypothetical protein YpsIP31758_0679 [Yersinia pseudotuberculosis IP 31758]UFA60325.1 Uncharacterized protein YP598_0699 [Yersinia pseudotuberculosis]